MSMFPGEMIVNDSFHPLVHFCLAHLHFVLISSLLTFSPMHFLGFHVMQRMPAKKKPMLSRFVSLVDFRVIYWIRNTFAIFWNL